MNNPSMSNTYEYGDAEYWDARYWEQAGSSFDWYQRFSALRPFINKFIPSCSKILMVGCGNARISEDMVKDGYEDIMNIDISSIVIEMMRKRCMHIPHLKCILLFNFPKEINNETSLISSFQSKRWSKSLGYPNVVFFSDMQMDVRDMSFFEDESFDSVIDKGTLDSLMCSTDASFSAFLMIEEVNRLLKPGGIYMLITYGDPSVRIPHLNQPGCCWKITLYIIPRAGFESVVGSSSSLRSVMEPVPLTEDGLLAPEYVLEDPDSHYIYICKKMEGLSDPQIF